MVNAESLAARHNISRRSAALMSTLANAEGIYAVDVYGATNGIVDAFLVNRRDVVLATRWGVDAYLSCWRLAGA